MDDVVAWVAFLGGFAALTAGCRWLAHRLAPKAGRDDEPPGPPGR